MKFAILALLGGVSAVDICRNDSTCRVNFFKQSCCSHFRCNAYCNTTRCRTDTCGQTICRKTAQEFVTRVIPAGPPTVAIIGRPGMPAVHSYDPWGRPTGIITPAIPAIIGRRALPTHQAMTCLFPTEGIATIPRENEIEEEDVEDLVNLKGHSECHNECWGKMYFKKCYSKCKASEEELEDEDEVEQEDEEDLANLKENVYCKTKYRGTVAYTYCNDKYIASDEELEDEEDLANLKENAYCKKKCWGPFAPKNCYDKCRATDEELEDEDEVEQEDEEDVANL